MPDSIVNLAGSFPAAAARSGGRLVRAVGDAYTAAPGNWAAASRPVRAPGGVNSRVIDLLGQVGLRAADAERFPHEFSGGQRQRLNIARALALSPDVIICDEPTSGLDVSVQAQICNLLLEIARSNNTSCLFISHDLAVVQMMTERVMVLNRGRIVESCESSELPRSQNIYTQMLIDAIPGNGGQRSRGEVSR